MHAPTLSYEPLAVTAENLHLYPEDYRRDLVRLLSMQAYAERLGATELAAWVRAAPNFRDRVTIAKIASDEARHSFFLYVLLERLGVSEAAAMEIAEGGAMGKPSEHAMAGPKAVADPHNEWIDIVINNLLLDRVGKFMNQNFALSSYRPWAEACKKILLDEQMHVEFGVKCFQKCLKGEYGPPRDEAELAGKVSSWYARGLNFFGPPSKTTAERQRLFGLKRKSSDELRREYREEVETVFEEMGKRHFLRTRNDAYPYEPFMPS